MLTRTSCVLQRLFLSGDIAGNSTQLQAFCSWINANQVLHAHLREIVQVLLPDTYAEYDAIFNAGKVFDNDSAPFLGKAIMYKLQLKLHKDLGDRGWTISLPVGSFTGGHLIIPQLELKLK